MGPTCFQSVFSTFPSTHLFLLNDTHTVGSEENDGQDRYKQVTRKTVVERHTFETRSHAENSHICKRRSLSVSLYKGEILFQDK